MKLLVSKHGQQISEYDFPESLGIVSIEIGRSASVHIMIDDPMISRVHAKLEKSGSEWNLVKVAKFGELSLNGRDCEKGLVKQNDLVEMGDYTIRIIALDEAGDTQSSHVSIDHVNTNTSNDIDDDDFDKTEIQDFISESGDEDDYTGINSDNDEQLDTNDEDENESSSLFDDDNDIEANMDTDEDSDGFGFDDSSGFGDDDSDGGFDGDDKTGVFSGFATFYLRVFGENTSYDRFKIPNGETFIGRSDEKCQLVIPEDDVSTVHAVIKKSMVNCVLEDLKSSNGTLLNGERVNRAELVNGDEFVIGSTTFTVEVTSDLIKEEKGRLMPVEPNQEITIEEVVEEEVDFGELGDIQDPTTPQTKSKSIFKDPKKRRFLMYGGVILLMLLLFVDTDDGDIQKKKKKKKSTDDQGKVVDDKGKASVKKTGSQKNNKKYTKEQLEQLEAIYQVGVRYFGERNYADARAEFSRIMAIDSTYKNIETYIRQTDQALAELSKAEERRREKEKRLILEAEVKKLMQKANDAFSNKNIELTKFYMNKVSEKDPENLELPYLKVEVDTYIDKKREEEERIRKEKAARKKMVDQLKPGEGFFYQREWYKAILKLESFTRLKDIDNDLLEKAANMMKRARTNLRNEVEPLLGEARSLREGQDLKGAYELYSKIYEIDQSNIDVLNEMEEIRTKLNNRSKKIYREALIAESLSLFDEAKEKFQQVQQISPSDGEYYRKATERLKGYLE